MPIRIHEIPEPLTPAALDAARRGAPSSQASSDALRILAGALERYARGEVKGRSFLISGHRGSGKSTLVLSAVQEVLLRGGRPRSPDERFRRPLLVPLQGPALLPSRPAAAEKTVHWSGTAPNDGADGGTARRDAPDGEDSELATVLQQITLGLYRALVREIADCYEDKISNAREDLALSLQLPRLADAAIAERVEFAAQLRLELDDAPEPERLRAFWKRADALSTGVLFGRPAGRAEDNQGMRELVALAAAGQAYRKILGRVERKTRRDDSAEEVRERKIELAASAKEIFRHLVALLTGGVVGVGLVQDGATGSYTLAGLAGLTAAWATSAAFSLSASASRRRRVDEEYTFIRDTDVATLQRELPILIERVENAGLAPVFVVDELDKVADLHRRMDAVIDHLKLFVAEKAFFCFLSDRDYFEYLRKKSLFEAYPKEHTYFTDRLFVVHQSGDLHDYLGHVLRRDDTGSGAVDAVDLDRDVLPFIVLHRARMHPVDIRRELRKLRGRDGIVQLTPGVVRSRWSYRLDITVQLAVEHLLASERVRERIEQDPAFVPAVYDALYYPSRRWSSGEVALDLSADAFRKYLVERMHPLHDGRSASEAPNGWGEDLPISETDVAFLHELAKDLVGLLVHPGKLRDELLEQAAARAARRREQGGPPTGGTPRAAIGAISVETRLLTKEREDLYHWQFDPFGRPLADGAAVPARRLLPEDLAPDADRLLALDAALRSWTQPDLGLEALSNELGLMPTSPDWRQVEEAARRVIRHRDTGDSYPELTEDQRLLEQYIRELEERSEVIAKAYIHGAALGRARMGEGAPRRLERGLRVLCEALDFKTLVRVEAIADALTRFGETARRPATVGLRLIVESPLELGAEIKLADQGEPVDWPEISARAWQTWRGRLREYLRDPSKDRIEPTEDDLLLEVAERSPAGILRRDLGRMTLGEWSRALLPALDRESDSEMCPLWLAAPILTRLGFPRAAETIGKEDRSEEEIASLQEELAELAALQQPRLTSSALVLADSRRSPVVGRPVPRNWAVLLFPLDQDKPHLLAVFKNIVQGLASAAQETPWLLVEQESPDSTHPSWIPSFVKEWRSSIGAVRNIDFSAVTTSLDQILDQMKENQRVEHLRNKIATSKRSDDDERIKYL